MAIRNKTFAFLVFAPLALAACVGSTTSTSGTAFPPALTTGDGFQSIPAQDASFGTLINGVRATAGVAPLTYNALLDQAAQGHAQDMFANNYFSHTDLKGGDVAARVTATGYNWVAVGENIAQGQQTENIALNDWVNSPPHQANNVRASFKEFGLGRAGTGAAVRWVLVFGAQN